MTLVVGHKYNGIEFSNRCFESLQLYHTETNGLYFDLGFNRIKFKEYVGVIQVGSLTIEILPKADNLPFSQDLTLAWKKRLIDMLRTVGTFDIQAPSSSALLLKSNSILDLYFELYIRELEYLLHRGLIKKYRKCEGNLYALKGALLFHKHFQHNLVHRERSYVRHTVYDVHHELHCILFKALRLLKQINHQTSLQSRIGALLLHFPEMEDIAVSERIFQKQILNRKTQHYERALQIARLLLMNYHPDISKGRNHVLALMFDMNLLWEQFVFESLRKGLHRRGSLSGLRGQWSKKFWLPENGRAVSMRPDIVIEHPSGKTIVLDTKWKNLDTAKVSVEDLRQMFVYHQYFGASEVALIYPGVQLTRRGLYYNTAEMPGDVSCHLLAISPDDNIGRWQKNIASSIIRLAD